MPARSTVCVAVEMVFPAVEMVFAAVETVCVVVCIVLEMTWPTGLRVVVAAICLVALLAVWLIAPVACLDNGPTVLAAAPVVFWSALLVGVVSAPAVWAVARGAGGTEGVARAEGVEGTEGVEGVFRAAGGATLPVACVAVATVWPAVRPTSAAPLDSGFAVAGPTQASAPSTPSAAPLAKREIVLGG